MKQITEKWDKNYLNLAKHVSGWSKDPSTKVGAVAVGGVGQILATGYNGFPRGIDDSDDRLSNREIKYKYVVHAEMNCIYNATHNGVSLNGATLYVHGLPACSDCAKGIIQVGIKRVVCALHESIPETWLGSYKQSMDMFRESGVLFDEIRKENL